MTLNHAGVLSIVLLAACATDPTEGCTEIGDLRVSDGVTPTIGWTPRCGVHRVVIYATLPETAPPGPGGGVIVGQLMWDIRVDRPDANTMRPPIQYGVTPAGAVVGGGPEPLIPGTEYVLLVGTVDPRQYASPSGYLEFVP